jgi:hypothetical protein
MKLQWMFDKLFWVRQFSGMAANKTKLVAISLQLAIRGRHGAFLHLECFLGRSIASIVKGQHLLRPPPSSYELEIRQYLLHDLGVALH